MTRIKSLLRIDALPANVDLALLVLRIWVGTLLMTLHGFGKLERLFSDNPTFRSVFGLDPTVSLALAVLGEVIAPIFLIIGLGTRWAALLIAITMSTAFVTAHGMALSGERSGELPFLFLGGAVAIFLAGAGRFSVDGQR